MSTLAFFLMFLHISAYSSLCFSSSFPTIPVRFVIRARIRNTILDFSGLLITLFILFTLLFDPGFEGVIIIFSA